MKFGISFNTKFLNQANALVNVYLDGTVQVSTGATEMGQGVNTKIAQLVADTLCISVESVMVMPTSTEKNHNTSATAASSSADLNGSAAVNASLTLRERLLDFASQHFARLSRGLEPGVQHLHWDSNGILDKRLPEHTLTFQELVKLAYLERINLGERGFHATEGIEFSWETGSGSPFLYFTTGCAVSEVLIDRFTGNLQVLRADLLMDIGRSINPGIDRGQIVGGFMQGLGWLTTEELVYSEDGHLLSHSPTTYKIPSINDLPEIFEVDWIANDENTVNIKSSKAVGEPPLMLALSVWCAVKHALSFVSNGEIPTLHIPATNQEILARLTQYQSSPALAEPSALLKV
jgi:xanthine dehydrogenase large subunit